MSPIGRVFLVLNLALAGSFIAFSGTYLQRADNWRQMHETLKKDSDAEIARLSKLSSAMKTERDNQQRIAEQLEMQKGQLVAQIEEKVRDNAALQARLSTMEGAMKSADAHLATIADELRTARTESKASMDRAIAAEAAKDEAERQKLAAQKSLDDSNFQNKNKDEQILALNAQIAAKDQDIREKKVLLDLVTAKFPAIFETIHPLVTGTVSRVGASGNLVTISLKSGAENLKAGARFAIFNSADGYLGEATVSEVDDERKFCFARVTLNQGKKINAGDSASTNLSASGSN